MTEAKYATEVICTKVTPYLPLSGELWGAFVDRVITALHCMLISSTKDDVLCSCLILELISPSDAIWRHRYGSTLTQVVASCLAAASSHNPNQCLLIINVFCGIQMMTISHAFLKISIHDMSLKMTNLRVQPHLPGANDLISFNDKGCVSLYHRLPVLLYAAGNIDLLLI